MSVQAMTTARRLSDSGRPSMTVRLVVEALEAWKDNFAEDGVWGDALRA